MTEEKKLMRKISVILDIDQDNKHGFKTYLGEDILDKDENVSEYSKNEWCQGVLYVTNYRTLFIPKNTTDESLFTSIPLASVHKLEKIGGKSTSQKGKIY